MYKTLFIAALVPLAVLGADLASHPVILQETEEQKPSVVDETAGDSADVSKADEISDASQEAISKMNE